LEDHAIVVAEDLEVRAVPLVPRGLERERIGAIDASAPQRVQDHLLSGGSCGACIDALHEQVMAMGERNTGRLALVLQVADQCVARVAVQREPFTELALESRVADCGVGAFEQLTDLLGKVVASRVVFGAPEGQVLEPARRRDDEDVVVGDAFDAPLLRAEGEAVTDLRFPDELLVELADQCAAVLAPQLEVAPVRDRPPREIEGRQTAPVGARRAVDGVHGDSRPQVSDAGVGIAARQHLQDQVEEFARQLAVGVARPECSEEIVHGAVLGGAHRDDHLSQHVEGRAHGCGLLDAARLDLGRQHRRVQQIAAGGRKEGGAADLAHAMPGAAGALDRRSDGGRRLEHQYLVQRADVDSQLERARGDDRLQLPRLEPLLHLETDLPGQRAVVGIREQAFFVRVEQTRHLLAHAPAVDEDERRAIRVDAPLQLRDQRIPDRFVSIGAALVRGKTDFDVVALGHFGAQDRDRPRRPGAGDGIVRRKEPADELRARPSPRARCAGTRRPAGRGARRP
jgi:hypothetical protein